MLPSFLVSNSFESCSLLTKHIQILTVEFCFFYQLSSTLKVEDPFYSDISLPVRLWFYGGHTL